MFGVTLAEVVVNVLTGEVNVTKVVSIVDSGKVINPITFTGQVEGAVAQGIGYALMEEAKIEGGYLLTRDLSTYLIPELQGRPRDRGDTHRDRGAGGPIRRQGDR
jgi:Aerobic-type carbon monoxide dehydrogenase, large subunit CoxL/CutL homologs